MRVFVSYSSDDEDMKNALLKHLAPAGRARVLASWDESKVMVGDEKLRVVEAELRRADVAVVLLSAAYFGQGGPADRDLVRIEERRALGELRIVPIVVSPCDWQADARVKDLQVLPRDGQPLRSRRDREEALVEACREIVALATVSERAPPGTRPSSVPDTSPSASRPAGSPPPPRGALAMARSINWRNPGSVLSAAVAAVPVMKYALGVAGLAAVVAIVTRGFGLDAVTATVGTLIVLALMAMLIVLAVAARQSQRLVMPAMVLTWSVLFLMLCSSSLLLLSLFFHIPRPLRCLVHDELCAPAPERNTKDIPLQMPPPILIELPIESTPSGAKVWSVDNVQLCKATPCRISVPAHAPLELHFDYPGREYLWKTSDPTLELQKGGVRVNVPPKKVQ